jgi:capsular exopolysaccharide synthesis family protein
VYLSDLLAALRRHWFVAVAALALWVGVGVVMATVPSPRYKTSVIVAVQPGPNTVDLVGTATYQIPIILKVIESNTFYDKVETAVGSEFRTAPVAIAATSPIGTGLINVTVSGGNPNAVAAWANAAGSVLAAQPDPSGLVLQLIERAGVPSKPYAPKVTPIAVGTTALGLLSAVIAAVVVARVSRALDVAEEIQRRFEVPVLGRVPALNALRAGKGGQVTIDALERSSEVVEAFRALATNLELALMSGEVPAVLAVLSGSEGEGKSTVAAGIAVTMAMSGNAVLAVDADLRRPTLHVRLGMPLGAGLAKAGNLEVGDLVQRTDVPNLWLLSAGLPDRHPADLLAASLSATLDYSREQDRRMIIDCPPLNGVAETTMVAAMANNVLLVVDPRRTDVPDFEVLLTRLRTSGVRVVGVVLNRVGRPRRLRSAAYSQALPGVRGMGNPARPVARRRPWRSG